MTVVNNIFYANTGSDRYREPAAQRFVWAEHDNRWNSLSAVTMYASKDAVKNAWKDVFCLKDADCAERIQEYDTWIDLLNETCDTILRVATRMPVEQ